MLRHRLVGVALWLGACAAATASEAGSAPSAQSPSISPDGSTAVFSSDIDGNQDLWTVNLATGRQLRLLAWPDSNEKQPDWARIGSRIAFSSNRSSPAKHQIWTVNADGSDPRRLTTDDATHEAPRYSPDGSKILYLSNATGKRELWIMNADGTNQRALALIGLGISDPVWSPDGLQIAYVGCRRQLGCNIYRINADASGGSQVTSGNYQDWTPDWGPGGIVFASNRNNSQGLWIIQPDGSSLRQVSAPPSTGDLDPRWVPDGSILFARSGRSGIQAASEVWLLPPLGAPARQLTTTILVVAVDVKPGSCPNPFNSADRGVVPVALVGTESFDVRKVDPTTLRLVVGEEAIVPVRYSVSDVATPYEPYAGKPLDAYACHIRQADGRADLVALFDAQQVAALLGAVAPRTVARVQLRGRLTANDGGSLFVGEDIVLKLR